MVRLMTVEDEIDKDPPRNIIIKERYRTMLLGERPMPEWGKR